MVELLVNDLSLHRQFPAPEACQAALDTLMAMRRVAQKYGWRLLAHRNLVNLMVTPSHSLFDVIKGLPPDKLRVVKSWLGNDGPFCDDEAVAGPDDSVSCGDIVVTHSTVGEAALRTVLAYDIHHLVSLAPSDWIFSPIDATWTSGADTCDVSLANFWTAEGLERELESTAPKIDSWQMLEDVARARFHRITFCDYCFDPLRNRSFVAAICNRAMVLLSVLDRLKPCFAAEEEWTPETRILHQNYFVRKDTAIFSNASTLELNSKTSQQQMTFPHPSGGDGLFCSWHGKIRTQQYRIHYAPPLDDGPLYVAYIGPHLDL